MLNGGRTHDWAVQSITHRRWHTITGGVTERAPSGRDSCFNFLLKLILSRERNDKCVGRDDAVPSTLWTHTDTHTHTHTHRHTHTHTQMGWAGIKHWALWILQRCVGVIYLTVCFCWAEQWAREERGGGGGELWDIFTSTSGRQTDLLCSRLKNILKMCGAAHGGVWGSLMFLCFFKDSQMKVSSHPDVCNRIFDSVQIA